MRRRKNRSGNPAILAVGLAFVVVLQAMQQSSGMVH